MVFNVLDEKVGTVSSMSRGTLSRVCHGMTPYNGNGCTFPAWSRFVYLDHLELVK
jgi:hypothetical protein